MCFILKMNTDAGGEEKFFLKIPGGYSFCPLLRSNFRSLTLLHKSSEWSSLISGPGLNSPLEAKNPGILLWVQQQPFILGARPGFFRTRWELTTPASLLWTVSWKTWIDLIPRAWRRHTWSSYVILHGHGIPWRMVNHGWLEGLLSIILFYN